MIRRSSPSKVDIRSRDYTVPMFMAVAVAMLIVGILEQGYFYDRSFTPAAFVLFALLLWMLLRSGMNGIGITHLQIREWLPLLFPFIAAIGYSLTLLLEPASVQGTWLQVIRYAAYGVWGVLLVCMVRSETGTWEQLWHLCITGIGWLISLGAMMMLYGWLPYESGVMLSSNTELSALGFRLAGWFQYPNALGAVAGAYSLYHAERLMRAQTQAAFAIAGTSVLLHLCVLALTESRGAWLTVLVVAAAHILLCCWRSVRARKHVDDRGSVLTRVQVMLGIGWVLWFGIFAAAAASATAKAWLTEAGWMMSLPLFVALASSVAIALLTRAAVQRVLGAKQIAGLLVLVAMLVIGVALWLLPNQSGSRWSGHFTTVSARTQFYKDALRMWQERPLFGSGGDAWRQQFASIQSEPYVGKEVHSIVADLLLDIGLIGTILTLLLAAMALFRTWWRAPGAGMAAAVILGHSVLDFDMSYGIVALLTMSWLAEGWFQKSAKPTSGTRNSQNGRESCRQSWGKIVLAVLLLVPTIVTVSMIGSQALHAAGVQRSNQAMLLAALRLTPADTALRIAASQQLPPLEAFVLLRQGERYERSGAILLRELAHAARRAEQPLTSAAYWLAAVSCDRYDSKLQTQAIQELASMAQDAARQGKPILAKELARSAQQHFASYEGEVQRIHALPHVANDKKFALMPEAQQAAASVYSISFEESE